MFLSTAQVCVMLVLFYPQIRYFTNIFAFLLLVLNLHTRFSYVYAIVYLHTDFLYTSHELLLQKHADNDMFRITITPKDPAFLWTKTINKSDMKQSPLTGASGKLNHNLLYHRLLTHLHSAKGLIPAFLRKHTQNAVLKDEYIYPTQCYFNYNTIQ